MTYSKSPKGNKTEDRMIQSLDDLALLEEFSAEMLPRLRKALSDGLSPLEIYSEFKELAAARLVTIALTEKDNGKALVAIKDILDRHDGKAVERKLIAHKFDQLPEEQLDSILLSRLEELEEQE